MKLSQIIYSSTLCLATLATLTIATPPASAATNNASLPEIEGTYNVPGRPFEKLRVHIYHPDQRTARGNNGGKPTPTPTLTCSPTATADPNSFSETHTTGWRLPSLWTYMLNTSSVPSTVGATNFPTIVANAFSSWTSSSTDLANAVLFQNGGNTSVNRATRDGMNIISWGRTSGSALAVTYTWYNTLTQEAVEIDTIFNKSFAWYWSDPSTWGGQTCAFSGVYDAENILTHELGHSIGLDDEYDSHYVHNTMYGYGATGETKKNTPTSGDLAGLATIY